MNQLAEKLANGDIIILDGGTGTELEKRGVPMNDEAWSASGLIQHGDTLREVHEDYIHAGADVIISNTFATSRHLLAEAGLDDQFAFLNSEAVKIAQQARDNASDRPVWVAGSISTTTMFNRQPPADIAKTNFEDQATILAEAGADLIILEMMRDVEYTLIALRAAMKTRLPVWVGFSLDLETGNQQMLWGKETMTLADGIKAVADEGISMITIMHSLTEMISPALPMLKENWTGPFGVYAHSGEFIMPNWQFVDMITPEDYAAEARAWVDMGAQVVGGCCGIGPEHIRRLKADLPSKVK